MSDCSTEAMKPKEPPKTCGNCFHCVPRHGTRFIKRDGVCLYCGEAVETQSTSPICPCGNHRMWRERTNTPEQRYQQLQQVAREMYKAIAPMHEYCCEDTCCSLGEMGWDADCCLGTFRDQLEALGVSLDD